MSVMRRLISVSLVVLLGAPAWAATVVETPKPITFKDVGLLTDEMKALVPALNGLESDRQTKPGVTILTIHRLTGEFSPAEVALLQQALSAHDPTKVPADPDAELTAAITAATTLDELKSALLGKTKAGKVAGRQP